MGRSGWFVVLGRGRWASVVAVALAVSLSAAIADRLAVTGRSNATPSIASDGDVVAIAWGASTPAGATDVYAAVSRDGGRTFGPPVRVNDVDGDARLNGEQPPRVAVRGTARDRGLDHRRARNGTKLVQSRSDDGGRTFAKATPVPGGDAAGNRGWENAVADRNGRVYAVWLDHRELAQQDGAVAASHHDHAGAADRARPPIRSRTASRWRSGRSCIWRRWMAPSRRAPSPAACATAARPRSPRLPTAPSSRRGATSIPATSATSRSPRRATAARRSRPPLRVSEDKWVLEGCPDDGPAMAVDAKDRVHIVWPTLITEEARGRSDHRAVLCDVVRRQALHAAASGFRPKGCRIIRRSRSARTGR